MLMYNIGGFFFHFALSGLITIHLHTKGRWDDLVSLVYYAVSISDT